MVYLTFSIFIYVEALIAEYETHVFPGAGSETTSIDITLKIPKYQ